MKPSVESCEAVLRGNDRGRYTVPSPKLYPHQWAWDSAFAAIGWAHIDPARAWTELQTLMDTAWDDGRIPHVYYHDLSGDYAPRPDFWETERTSTVSQPPVWATAIRRVAELTGDVESARPLMAAVEASHVWFAQQRDPLGWNAVSVAHPWESGMDNLPAWDSPMDDIDISSAPAFERRDTSVVGHADQRPTDDHYKRYAAIVKGIARDDFGHGPFAVYDPFMTAVLTRAEHDLAWLAERLGVPSEASKRHDALLNGLETKLWDEASGRYLYWDARANRAVRSDVVGCYLPLVCDIRSTRADTLREGLSARFATAWGVPTASPEDPGFEPRRYWRGPAWINVNWLLADALGPEHTARTLELVARNGMHEYFDPNTGEGLGADQFTWTAALSLDLLHRA